LNDQIKNEMSRACDTYWGVGNSHLENLGIDGRIILKWIFKRLDGRHELDCSGSG
jgi:hypothetical protein